MSLKKLVKVRLRLRNFSVNVIPFLPLHPTSRNQHPRIFGILHQHLNSRPIPSNLKISISLLQWQISSQFSLKMLHFVSSNSYLFTFRIIANNFHSSRAICIFYLFPRTHSILISPSVPSHSHLQHHILLWPNPLHTHWRNSQSRNLLHFPNDRTVHPKLISSIEGSRFIYRESCES